MFFVVIIDREVLCLVTKSSFVVFYHVDVGADVFETSSKRGYNVGKFQYNLGSK